MSRISFPLLFLACRYPSPQVVVVVCLLACLCFSCLEIVLTEPVALVRPLPPLCFEPLKRKKMIKRMMARRRNYNGSTFVLGSGTGQIDPHYPLEHRLGFNLTSMYVQYSTVHLSGTLFASSSSRRNYSSYSYFFSFSFFLCARNQSKKPKEKQKVGLRVLCT